LSCSPQFSNNQIRVLTMICAALILSNIDSSTADKGVTKW
jgi:hypothetical protein